MKWTAWTQTAAFLAHIWPGCSASGVRVGQRTPRWRGRCACSSSTGAYAALREEGFLASRRGSGSWTRLPADPGTTPLPVASGEDVIDLSCAASAAADGALHAALA